MIRYLIIDDEPVAHDIIQGYCDLLSNFQLQKRCYDALEALDFLNTHSVDLIQVHKSFVVAKKHIHSIEGNQIFMEGHIVPIGRTYKSQVIQLYR